MSKTIHAYRRTEPIEVELFDQTVQFAPDGQGCIVAVVEDLAVAGRLLQIRDAYRLLKEADAEADAHAQAAEQAQAESASLADVAPAVAESKPAGRKKGA